MNVYAVATDGYTVLFPSEAEAAAFIREEIMAGSNTLGTELTFEFSVREMERSQYEHLQEGEE